MGIRFLCPSCEKKIHVKDHQAGLRGFCPKCGARVDIPLHSTLLPKKRRGGSLEQVLRPGVAPGAAGEQTILSLLPPVGRLLATSATPPVDPLGEFPNHQWYVVPQGGTEPFGPADGRLIGQWMQEGRIAARSMIWRQDWPEWRKAGNVWSQLILAEPAPTSRAEQRFTSGSPQFGTADVPKSSAAIPQTPARPAPRQTAPRPVPPPDRSDLPEMEVYYPRRSQVAYLAWVVLLAVAVVALGLVMFQVIDRLQLPRPDEQQQQPAEPNAPENVEPEGAENSETTAGRGRWMPIASRSLPPSKLLCGDLR